MYIEARAITKVYGSHSALTEVNLLVPPGQSVAISGPSGSGKSTLLGCLSGLIPLTSGQIIVDGQVLGLLNSRKLGKLRSRAFGVASTHTQLVPELSVIENVSLPLLLLGYKSGEARKQAQAWLDQLGIGFMRTRPSSLLSDGEAYLVSVARAVVHSPRVIFLDEPTGALDIIRVQEVLQILTTLTKRYGVSLLVSTRTPDVSTWCERQVRLQDGLVVSDSAWIMQPKKEVADE